MTEPRVLQEILSALCQGQPAAAQGLSKLESPPFRINQSRLCACDVLTLDEYSAQVRTHPTGVHRSEAHYRLTTTFIGTDGRAC